MKAANKKNNIYTKIATLLLPVVLILLVVSFYVIFVFGHKSGAEFVTLALPIMATVLAVLGIIFAIISANIDAKREDKS